MEEFSRGRPDGKPSDPGEGGAAVRTPSKGDSSSPGAAPPSDSPTLIDVPGQSAGVPSSDAPTMVDIPGSDPSDSPTMVDGDTPTMLDPSPLPGKPAPPRIQRPQSNPSMLQPGAILGQRYEILQILGEGGMGAVYKARDRELNRMVALKVIRPDLAGSQAIIDRFKQELLLATQVTHKNVIRIYDLSEAEGMKFITMEFVEGEDLRGLMQKKGKLAPEEAVEIMQQTCRALEAAHSAGIIHRDLKPQNIMRDKTGRILVMDFGLARTLEGDGMTQTGALVGTMDYMSPEQALGKELDQRSDLFALGLIFYEMLTGKMPYKADSVVASLLKRTQERAVPVSSHDASIPKPLSDIVSKCMEPDVKLRYQSSAEILADLDAWQGGHAAAHVALPQRRQAMGTKLSLALVRDCGRGRRPRDSRFRVPRRAVQTRAPRRRPGPVVSLAILPFRNASGDPALDWLGSEHGGHAEHGCWPVGAAAHCQPQRSAPDIHRPAYFLRRRFSIRRRSDAWLISATRTEWSGASTPGSATRSALTPRLQDIKNDRTVPLKIDVPSEKEIPGAVDRLAESIRQKLALPEDVLKELKASSFQPSFAIDATRCAITTRASGLQRDGKKSGSAKAIRRGDQGRSLRSRWHFPGWRRPTAVWAMTVEAEQSAKKAVALSQDLPAAEKYLISAIELQVVKNYPEAIKAYENLARVIAR